MSARTPDAMFLMLMFHCPALLLQILLLAAGSSSQAFRNSFKLVLDKEKSLNA